MDKLKTIDKYEKYKLEKKIKTEYLKTTVL